MSAETSLQHLKVPPQSLEAEQAVLGGLLIDNDALDRVADILRANDYYHDAHRLIFEHVQRLLAENKPADIITVGESLERSGRLEGIGGIPYLAALAEGVPSAANVRRYAEIVREKAILRQLTALGAEISESAYNPQGASAKALLDQAEAKVLQIAEHGARNNQGFQDIRPLLMKAVEHIQELYGRDNPSEVTGIPTGFQDLDQRTSGLHPGDLVIVAGRPSMGKTAFSLNMAENVAIQTHKAVAVFSMEMGAQQLAMRMIGSVGKLDQHKLRTGQLHDHDWERLSLALGKLNDAPLFIDETPALNSLELRSRARRLHRQQQGLGLIVIDYLQLMQSINPGENRATEVSEISRSLKALAKELQVPVIALSQLNRGLEQRPNKRPVMSDLRESGAIEQDADLILFIYRDEVYHPDTDQKGTAEIIIGKQRNGPIGTVRLAFLGEHTRFENLAHSAGGGFYNE
jgi:replicative DNA helicase